MKHVIKSMQEELQQEYEYADNRICIDSCKLTCECENCRYFQEYWWGLKQSLIPEKLHSSIALKPEKIDVPSFELLGTIRQGIVKFVEEGRNLYLYSDGICGNGKTSWAFKLLQTYLFNVSNPYLECKGLYISVPLFMMDSRFSISGKNLFFYEVVELIKKVDIVIWDDIGAAETKGYDYQNLLALINLRDVSKLTNIYTSNLKHEDLIKVFDNRFASRVWDNSVQIELKGSERRGL